VVVVVVVVCVKRSLAKASHMLLRLWYAQKCQRLMIMMVVVMVVMAIVVVVIVSRYGPVAGRCGAGSDSIRRCCEGVKSSRCWWRSTAVLAGVSSKTPPPPPPLPSAARPYGDSYSCPAARNICPSSSGSDLVDRPRLLFPDDPLDWLAVLVAVGVNTAEMGIRVAGGSVDLGSPCIAGVMSTILSGFTAVGGGWAGIPGIGIV